MNTAGKFCRIVFLITIICLVMSTIVGFLMLQSMHSHECNDHGCEICLALNSIKENFKGFLFASFALFLLNRSIFILRKTAQGVILSDFSDLVSLKVKLSD